MNEQAKMTLSIDWTPENAELNTLLKNEDVDFSSIEGIVKSLLLNNGLNSAQAGVILVAARERGLVDSELWPDNRFVMRRGSMSTMQLSIMKAQINRELPNGHTVKINPVIGDGHQENENEEVESSQADNVTQPPNAPFISTISPQAAEYAKQYILGKVIGHIKSRLAIIAANEGDVKGVARELKKEIDKIVKEYT